MADIPNIPDTVYGQAWLDHSRWLRNQGNAVRAGADRDRFNAAAVKAYETGMVALGYILPAKLLPFDLPFTTGLSDHDVSTSSPYPRPSWWMCRYCGRGEGSRTGVVGLPMTPAAEKGRAYTHESMCADRPASNPVTADEKRVVGEYLRGWLRPRLDLVDNEIAMWSPRPGYQQTDERNRELARWQLFRAEYLSILTRCGVDDDAMVALPPVRQQTRDEFLAEIGALAAGAGPAAPEEAP